MSRFTQLTEEIRSSPTYLPPCPACSHIGVIDFRDQIVFPSHYRTERSVTLEDGSRVIAWRSTIARCCALSDDCPWFETVTEAAAWWAEKRRQPLDEPALNNRRISTLKRLLEAGYEPCEPIPEQPPAGAARWDEQASERRLGL